MIYKLEIHYKDNNKYEKIKKNVDVQVIYNKENKVHKIVFGDEIFIMDNDNVISYILERVA